MKVIILAAGKGGRLGDLVKDMPKALLPFGKESILERQLRFLESKGFEKEDIIVVAGYKAEKIHAIEGITVIENQEYASTDNSYSLWLALQKIENTDSILILDGDLVFDESILDFIIRERDNTIIGMPSNNSHGNTGIIVDDKYRLIEIGKHISSEIIYAGIMKISYEYACILKENLKGIKKTWYTVGLNNVLKNENFYMAVYNGKICGINTYSDYLEAKRLFKLEDYNIWVSGASGFLGSKIYNILKRKYNTIGTRGNNTNINLPKIDLLDKEAVEAFVKLNKPSVIVHAAGVAEPEKCIENRDMAYKLNVEIVKNLIDICSINQIKFIHISTDYVFDGCSDKEYEKNDERVPCNYYGELKKMAEDIVLEYPNSLIVRIPIIYGYNDEYDKLTFPVKVIESLRKGKKIYLDNKQIRYPVLIDDVAFSIENALKDTGIIHITSEVPVTKYSWAKIIAKEFLLDDTLVIEDYESSLEDRPKHVKLKTSGNDYCVTDIEKGTEILKKQMSCLFKLIYKSNPVENIYNINVGKYRYELGQKLGCRLPGDVIDDVDYIVPVPNSGLYYAMGMSDTTGIPYLQALSKPDTLTRSFWIEDVSNRKQVIKNKIEPIKELIFNKKIVLVDEAIFTGVTLKVVCDIVKACGVQKIYLAIPTPICKNSCRQYVQPLRTLLSEEIDEKGMADYFRVDGVFFQSYDIFLESINSIGSICMDCFLNIPNNV